MRGNRKQARDPLAIFLLILLACIIVICVLTVGTTKGKTGPLSGTLLGFILLYLSLSVFVLGTLVLIHNNRHITKKPKSRPILD